MDNNLSDPDWGHKPEDDDFKIGKDDIVSYLMADISQWADNLAIDSILTEVTPQNVLTMGQEYFSAGKHTKARAIFEKGAKQFGNPVCAFLYGMYLAENIGARSTSAGIIDYLERGPKDDPEKYLQQAIDGGVKQAAFAYGLYLAKGEGMAKDEKRSYKYVCQAADMGYEPAKRIVSAYKKERRKSLFKSIFGSFVTSLTDSIIDVSSEAASDFAVDYLTGRRQV